MGQNAPNNANPKKVDHSVVRYATVVVLVVLAVIGGIMALFRESLVPVLLDNVFQVTQHVSTTIEPELHSYVDQEINTDVRRLTSNVQSGYTRSFYFDENTRVDQSLLFYAKRGQYATLRMRGVSDPSKLQISIKVDNSVEIRTIPPPGFNDLTLGKETDEAGVHTIKITPLNPPLKYNITIDCLVLVTDNPQD
jgi:hypothetical protein